MPNQNPVDYLDFTPQAPSPSPKKGMSRRTLKGIATLLLVLAGGLAGYAINSLMGIAAGGTVTTTTSSSLSQAATVYEGLPDSNYLQGAAHPQQQGIYSLWGYMTFPLASRPNGFTSAIMHLYCKGYNYTWVNVSLVTEDWNETTVSWNTRPARGPQVGCIPVETTMTSFKNVTLDVTAWVGSSANISLCLTVLYNNTRADFSGSQDAVFIVWSYETPISADMTPIFTIMFAAAIAVIVMILMTRKSGGN